MNTVFKTATTDSSSQYAEPAPAGDGSTSETTNIEPPFTEYKSTHKLPYVADYMDVKLTWDESDMVEDVETIESYLQELAMNGDLDNTVKSAKDKLKSLEKMANIDKLESNAQRLIKLAEFIKYLKNLNERTKHGWD